MIYAISGPDSNRLREIAKLFQYRFQIYIEKNPPVLFVSGPVTAKNLYDEIVKKYGEGSTILIIGIQTYYGWASPQLWEWLNVQIKT